MEMDKSTTNCIMADATYFLALWLKGTDLSDGKWIHEAWEDTSMQEAISARWHSLLRYHGTTSAVITLITEIEESGRNALISYIRKQIL